MNKLMKKEMLLLVGPPWSREWLHTHEYMGSTNWSGNREVVGGFGLPLCLCLSLYLSVCECETSKTFLGAFWIGNGSGGIVHECGIHTEDAV